MGRPVTCSWPVRPWCRQGRGRMAKAGKLIYAGLLIAWDGFWVIWLSDLLWLVFCLLLVTAPLGFAGLYECAHGLANGK